MKMSAALVAVALLAGCGGSDGDPGDNTAKSTPAATASRTADDTISAATWSNRVKSICVKSAAKATKAGEKLGRKSAAAGDSRQELAYKTLALTSGLLDPWLDKIDALPPPEGREQDADEFVATMRDVRDVLARTATAIKQNDQTTGEKLIKQLKAKSVTARGQARDLGIAECNPPSA